MAITEGWGVCPWSWVNKGIKWGDWNVEAQRKNCEESQGTRALTLDVGALPPDASVSEKAQWHGCGGVFEKGYGWKRALLIEKPSTRFIIHIRIQRPLLPSSCFSVSLWLPLLAEVTKIGWQRRMEFVEFKSQHTKQSTESTFCCTYCLFHKWDNNSAQPLHLP